MVTNPYTRGAHYFLKLKSKRVKLWGHVDWLMFQNNNLIIII